MVSYLLNCYILHIDKISPLLLSQLILFLRPAGWLLCILILFLV